MKKILSGIIITAIVALASLTTFAADSASVEISSNGKDAKCTYNTNAGTSVSKDITSLFSNWKKVTPSNNEFNQDITVTSKTANNTVVDLSLRLLDKRSTDDTTALNKYSVTVKDTQGNVVVETTDSEMGDEGYYVKNLPLGKFNSQFSSDVKNYNVAVKVDGSEDELRDARENIIMEVVSSVPQAVVNTTTQAPNVTSAPTQAPTVTVSPSAAPTATPEATKAKGTKYVGKDKDIVPGKYTATGNGTVKVYDKDNKIKSNVLLNDGKGTSKDGVDKCTLDLAEGDRVEISDYINMDPVSATASPKTTVTPRVTATPMPAAKATAVPKTNPKTGDTAPITAVSIVALLSLGVCVFMEIKKRKKN